MCVRIPFLVKADGIPLSVFLFRIIYNGWPVSRNKDLAHGTRRPEYQELIPTRGLGTKQGGQEQE